MRFFSNTFSIAALSSLIGCASYAPQPLTVNHPAHAQAAVAAIPRASQTLAYTAADLPSRSAAADQGGHDAHHGSDTPAQKVAVGEGKVVAVVPSSGQLVIEHGPIKDFMDAMTMGYPIEPASLLEGLKPGDRVRFAIDPKRKVIVKVEKTN
jgi:Cu/Ag efflux protein CusF